MAHTTPISSYVAQIAIMTQNEKIGPIASAMHEADVSLHGIENFFEYWENFDGRSGEWNDDNTEYLYDLTQSFNVNNIADEIITYWECIHADHLKMKLDTVENKIDDIKHIIHSNKTDKDKVTDVMLQLNK